ncbi:hypothetical protein, partial [Klebsiella pneumoniae]|uniref:hypothetical protein n=1 Tax=Klebsiella pneumoniae TaxID=573 RepID=UPI001D0DD664
DIPECTSVQGADSFRVLSSGDKKGRQVYSISTQESPTPISMIASSRKGIFASPADSRYTLRPFDS